MKVVPVHVALACSGLGNVRRGNETWAQVVGKSLHESGEALQLYGGGKLSNPGCPYKRLWNIRRDWPVWKPVFGWGKRYAYEQQTFARSLIRELKKVPHDIVHVADPVLAYRMRLVAKEMGFRLIYKDGLLLGSEWCRQFEWVQVLAPYYLEEANRQGFDTRNWSVISHIVDVKQFHPPTNRIAIRSEVLKTTIPNDAVVVLAAGDFAVESNKRLDWIVDEILTLGDPRIHLILAGQATRDQINRMQLKTRSMQNRIHLFPNTPAEAMPNLYRAADLFAHAALREPFGIVLIEAMASGLPVVGHHFPVTKWIIGSGGEVVDMAATGELASVLKRWTGDATMRETLGRQARAETVERFTPERIVPMYQKMYRTIRESRTK